MQLNTYLNGTCSVNCDLQPAVFKSSDFRAKRKDKQFLMESLTRNVALLQRILDAKWVYVVTTNKFYLEGSYI